MTIPVPEARKIGKAKENKSQRVNSTQFVVTKEVSTGAMPWVSFDVFDTEADARAVCTHLKAVFDGSDTSTTLSAHDDAILKYDLSCPSTSRRLKDTKRDVA